MLVHALLFRLARLLGPVCLIASTYLYSYPFFQRCGFPTPSAQKSSARSLNDGVSNNTESLDAVVAPASALFRLLILADPQLEGDTSIPKLSNSRGETEKPGLLRVQKLLQEFRDGDNFSEAPLSLIWSLSQAFCYNIAGRAAAARKRLDLIGNDYYLAHIYRTMRWWTEPTHVTVLGDLLGSQWIEEDEFDRRAWRFWNRVFKGGRIGSLGRSSGSSNGDGEEGLVKHASILETLGEDETWTERVINVAGNHDVGYAGDLDEAKVDRFERRFGNVNWDITFRLPEQKEQSRAIEDEDGSNASYGHAPEIRIVVLNTMNLDTPAYSPSLQGQTYDYINDVIKSARPVEDKRTAVILLTHIPLFKDEGVCTDGPFFDYWSLRGSGGIKEQNHLSKHASKGILEGIFGMSGNPNAPMNGFGRHGIILTGHDHEGCDVYHYASRPQEGVEADWHAMRFNESAASAIQNRSPLSEQLEVSATERGAFHGVPGIREVTLRSMMGEFGGNAGLLSAWWDESQGQWRIEIEMCSAGVQHWWWAVHISDMIFFALLMFAGLFRTLEGNSIASRPSRTNGVEKKE